MAEPANSNTADGPHEPGAVAGWREWVRLPRVPVRWIKAKLDTGARSSAIHAFDVEEHTVDGEPRVSFSIHPWQRSDEDAARLDAPVIDQRLVRSSNGGSEERLVVPMVIRLLGRDVTTEMTLSNRDEMGFRLLIGRDALSQGFLVDSARSYVGGRPRRVVRRKNWGR
ncbi:RimK/LysX family protein [Isoptericola sp. b441]|uniref:RimK/LysX family protein n=1 Tax=Actinotalea lenta TaxID=3064654 RepID=A0ABT9DBS5_9CELL|nr:RimK/LysX family protein [Isoptericola sp. b441]MDO8108332.1 RimK/LysX family protein [Isoptericola sp. b441]